METDSQLTAEQPAGAGSAHAAPAHATPAHASGGEEAWVKHAEQASVAHGEGDPLAPEALIGHVKDTDYFQVPRLLAGNETGHIEIPQIRDETTPSIQIKTGVAAIDRIFPFEPLDLKITKFMVLELIGALILVAIFVPLARRARSGIVPRGRIWNMLEAMVVFIRNEVARPTIGTHDGDRFTPFLLTIFFFVLACNLLGLVPWAGSPTGALATTGTLALITFATVVISGSLKMGVVGFWIGQVPKMDLPFPMGYVLKPMIFAIEVVGLGIKHFVLAMRLLANMMAGHVVLSVLVAFVAIGANIGWFAFLGIAPISIAGAVALNLLELFVAFLQAYIFAFLAGLFIGMAIHPH